MELRPQRSTRFLSGPAALVCAVCVAALLALGAPALAGADELVTPASPTKPPKGYRLSAREAIKIADRQRVVRGERRERGRLSSSAYEKAPRRWQVSYFEDSQERAQVLVDDRTSKVLEAWTGPQVKWRMARGYEGAFGHKLNAPYVWIPLCLFFLAPFVDFRRPLRLLHLDLLVLLAFGVSHVFFNRGEVATSVPLVYPVLLYLLARMLAIGFRRRERGERLVPYAPAWLLGLGILFLVGFRIALNVADSGVIDVGYAGVIGADQIMDGDGLYGKFPEDNAHGDTYGPLVYLLYIPFEQAFPWSGGWDDLPAAHAAAIAFDLLTALGLFVLGRRMRAAAAGTVLGAALAYAWLAYPYSQFALQSNSNDSLVAALLVWTLVVLSSPAGRGVLTGAGFAAKFATAALVPLLAAGNGRRSLRRLVFFALGLLAVTAALTLPFLPDGGFREIWDRTLGYQADRDSPFSIWGAAGGLEPLQLAIAAVVALLAAAVFFVPRARTTGQVAALGAAVMVSAQLVADHWFYLYIVWFAPLVLVALFAGLRTTTGASARQRGSARPDQQLLDRDRPSVVAGLDHDGVDPRVLV